MRRVNRCSRQRCSWHLPARCPGARAGHRLRRRAADRRRWHRRRERHDRGRRRADRAGRRQRQRACRRDARQSRRQDRDADDHRHPRASQSDARADHRRPEAARLLRRQRRHEHGRGPLSRCCRSAARTFPARRKFLSAGRGITMPEPGRMTAPHWIQTEAEARQGGAGARGPQGRHRQDLGRRLARQVQEADAGDLRRHHQRGARKNGLRVTAHIFELEDAKGLMRAGLDAFAHGVRDKDIDDEVVGDGEAAPEHRADPEPAGPRREDGPELAEGRHAGRGGGKAREGQRRQPDRPRRSSASRRAISRR